MRYLAALLLLTGCAVQPTERATSIREATADMVAKCEFVGTVTGASSLGGMAARDTAIENAKTEALNRAATRGATRVVWKALDNSFSSSHAVGDAFRCP
jgi:hypothetical protein